jgi:acid stress-induced BolA-like protein IbaG/YrbA|tara:strand:+ start:37 stop:291 length:255 start_codon:yes stop_codon:yes gene_type:complete
MLTPEYIKAVIQKNMECNFIEIKGDDGSHFEATIVSDIFEGLTKVMQHQKVYDALDGMMKQELHALSIKTYTSSQWDKSNMESN